MFVSERHTAADLHFFSRAGSGHYLSALQALVEIAQIALNVRLALLVYLLTFARLLTVQVLQFGHFRLQLRQARGRDVIGLRADLPFDRLIGLRGGVIFVDECPAHALLPYSVWVL